MITVTDNALAKLKEILDEEDDETLKVRLAINGGGCSGFRYDFMLEDLVQEDDLTFGNLVIDSMSMVYLSDATIDYIEDIGGSYFKVTNPNASTTCGCGSSFSV